MRRQCDIMSEDDLTSGQKASKTKGKEAEIEAAAKMTVTKTEFLYFPVFRKIANNLGDGSTNYHKIVEHFENNEREWWNGNTETLRRQLYSATVDYENRVDYNSNKKEREYIEENDIFKYQNRETRELVKYDPEKHGMYTIMMGQDGKTHVAKDGKIIGENSESPLLKFVRDEMQMQANYQPIVIKMLLENKDNVFSASYDTFREKFDELNFDSHRFKEGGRNIGSFGSSIDSIRGSKLSQFVSFDKGTTGTARLHLDKFDSKDIPEILKICGQKIVKWHIDNFVKDEFALWRVKPGREEAGWKYQEEFLSDNSVGVGWNDLGDLSQMKTERELYDYIKKVKPDFQSKSSVGAISQKMSKKDLVVVTRASQEIVDFGIITGEYEFHEKGGNSYAHRRRVVWLNQGPIQKSDFPDEDFGTSRQSAHEVHGSRRKKMIDFLLGEHEPTKYFLLRHAVNGPWKDDLGKKYHIGRKSNGSMGNLVKEIRDAGVGTKTVWWTASGVNAHFWGYGTVSKIETISEDKDWNLLYDDFKMFEGDVDVQGKMLKKATETVNQHIHDLEDNSKETGFAWRQSINRIPKKLYEEITSDRSHMSSSTISDIPDSFPYAEVLNFNKNLILYGPPGTGKTFKAEEAAEALTENQGDGNFIRKVTFHPSYSYEDFVEGFRPNVEDNNNQPYVLDDGIFKEICDEAKNDSGNRYVLLIDEINRGNIPKIFGELITVIENGYRGPDNVRALAYSKEKDNFYVPENLYIIGTMNTADKSLVQMDEALRRRFVFEELMPEPDLLEKKGRPGKKYKDILENINKKIIEGDKIKQFRDRQIGHSYFWPDPFGDKQMRLVIKYQIIPLLQDYFYDDYEEIKRILGNKIIGKDNRPGPILDEGNEKDLITELKRHLSGKSSAENENEEQN